MAIPLLDDLLNWVVPDRDACRTAADELRRNNPGLSDEELARLATTTARRWAAAAGGATGIATNPLVMLPAALADMSAMLKLEGQMAGVVAALLDPATLLNKTAFDADVVAIVFPGAVSQALRHVGVRAGQGVTRKLIQKYLTESFVKEAGQVAGKYLAIRVTEKAVVSKTIPLVGAGIGAAWNWVEMQAVGRRAIRYYQNRPIEPTEKKSKVEIIRSAVRRLPWRRSSGEEAEVAAVASAPRLPPPLRPDAAE
jgi:hypothetical protein